ncbi:hypothetical protein AMTRI_Chr01g129190 [Amborella trichopoda]
MELQAFLCLRPDLFSSIAKYPIKLRAKCRTHQKPIYESLHFSIHSKPNALSALNEENRITVYSKPDSLSASMEYSPSNFSDSNEVTDYLKPKSLSTTWNEKPLSTLNENTQFTIFSKSQPFEETIQFFNSMPLKDTVTWNIFISASTKQAYFDSSLQLFVEMLTSHYHPDAFTIRAVLKAISGLNHLEFAEQIHGFVVKAAELYFDLVIITNLIDIYIKNSLIENARQLFDRTVERDVVVFTAMMRGYTEEENCEEALRLFREMVEEPIPPNEFSFSCVLRACANLLALEEGKQVHSYIIKEAVNSDVFVGTALVNLYANCGDMESSELAFTEIFEPSVISWNALIGGSISGEEALRFFNLMRFTDTKPDDITFGLLVRACDVNFGWGSMIHGAILKYNLQRDAFVWSALVVMYANCGHKFEAFRVFCEAKEMGNDPDEATLAFLLRSVGDVTQGKQLHTLIIKLRVSDNAAIASSLVSMYCENFFLKEAQEAFNRVSQPDVVLWTAIISGFAQGGEAARALQFYAKMVFEGFVTPNHYTYSSILSASSELVAIEEGKQIHSQILKSGNDVHSDVFVASGLVDMYARSGFIMEARKLFEKMPKRDIVSWNAMIIGLAQHGFAEEAIETFEELLKCRYIKPNHVTFVGVLSACSHRGLVEDGYQYFFSIKRVHGLEPTIDHYACMIDLVGRAGLLEEAKKLLVTMPFEPNELVWSTLLGACSIHGNIELGELSAKELIQLNPKDPATYVALSNIYASFGRWDDVKKVRNRMRARRVRKQPGKSWIRVDGSTHIFFAGHNKLHPQIESIFREIEELMGKIKDEGYMPMSELVLHDVEAARKEEILLNHSEKLAITFGLMNAPPGSTIRVFKNLRVCGDCHSATKFISKVMEREIVVRDAYRYHHFRDGSCSCKDFW